MTNESKVAPVAWRSRNPEAIKAGQKYSDAENSTYFWSVLNHGQKWPEDVTLLYSHADYRALEEELAALRVRVGALVDASTYARRELKSCQAVIHLHGGFDPTYVEGAQKAMRDLSSALEDFA